MAVDVGTAMVATGAMSMVPAVIAATAAWRTHSKVAGNGTGTVTEIADRTEQRVIGIEDQLCDHVTDPTAHQPKDPEP